MGRGGKKSTCCVINVINSKDNNVCNADENITHVNQVICTSNLSQVALILSHLALTTKTFLSLTRISEIGTTAH